MSSARAALLSVRSLSVAFPTAAGPLMAVKDLSFDAHAGKTLAIVGESGSGKSVTAQAITRLVDYTRGRIVNGQILFRSDAGPTIDLAQAGRAQLRDIRGNEIAMIFQDPMTSLNPVFTVGGQIAEAIILHQGASRRQARRKAEEILDKVRIADADRVIDRYPHQLSGGMRQRVMIAMALSCRPKLLIADEPTTALDVTIQAQILNIIREQQSAMGMAVIFITHDMGVVAEMADDVVVMRAGEKVEEGPVRRIFTEPSHPYARALLAAVPRLGSLAGQPFPLRSGGAAGDAARPQDTVRQDEPILEVDDLSVRFDAKKNAFGRVTHRVHAVGHVSFQIFRGETLGLVGESGSGKSSIGRVIQQLLEPDGGSVRFHGRGLAEMSREDRRRLLQKVQYIFQDPFAALDPRRQVADSIAEPIVTHHLIHGKPAIRDRVRELLRKVGLSDEHAERYPHELSGGQRQRVSIARALASDPDLIVADESVSALDVSIRAQILDLLMELQAEQSLAYLFITHDMAVVEKISHRVAVMYLGQFIEVGSRRAIFETPQHAYTRKLLSAVPIADPDRVVDRTLLTGEVPSALRRVGDAPAALTYRKVAPGHFVAVELREAA
jgi:glutathione transport system ATP-binding protein